MGRRLDGPTRVRIDDILKGGLNRDDRAAVTNLAVELRKWLDICGRR